MYRFCLVLMLAALLFACSDDGELKIINRTQNDIYFNISDTDYVLQSNQSSIDPASISVSLDAGSEFLSQPQKTYTLFLQGETFAIYDYNAQQDILSTEIVIKGGETTSVYCDPNYACLRINNNSLQNVLSAYYIKSYNGNPVNISQAADLAPGQSIYKRLEYSLAIPQEPDDIFYYNFGITMQDGTQYFYGDESTILYLDDLYEINIDQ